MTTPSPRLKLQIPDQPSRFSTADLITNLNILDGKPGIHICTSTTRPPSSGAGAWTTAQAGMSIYETNTKLQWFWTGTGWVRAAGGVGILKTTSGAYAIGEKPADDTTSSSDPHLAVSINNVVVPDGHRSLMYVATWKDASNPGNGNVFPGYIYRSVTANSGPVIAAWQIGTIGGTFVAFDRAGLAPGTYGFSFQYAAPNGTSTLKGTSVTPISIAIIEL